MQYELEDWSRAVLVKRSSKQNRGTVVDDINENKEEVYSSRVIYIERI